MGHRHRRTPFRLDGIVKFGRTKNSLAGPVQGRGYSLGDSRRNKGGRQLPRP